jgi:hypothetical protein
LRIFLILETDGEIISEPDDDDVTGGEPIPPPLSPQVEHVGRVESWRGDEDRR